MGKEFVPYELALKLKEIGFDEPCFGYYTSPTGLLLQQPIGGNGEFVYYRSKVSIRHSHNNQHKVHRIQVL
jgi:hypothetical protein